MVIHDKKCRMKGDEGGGCYWISTADPGEFTMLPNERGERSNS